VVADPATLERRREKRNELTLVTRYVGEGGAKPVELDWKFDRFQRGVICQK
jgi:hypothetical protein